MPLTLLSAASCSGEKCRAAIVRTLRPFAAVRFRLVFPMHSFQCLPLLSPASGSGLRVKRVYNSDSSPLQELGLSVGLMWLAPVLLRRSYRVLLATCLCIYEACNLPLLHLRTGFSSLINTLVVYCSRHSLYLFLFVTLALTLCDRSTFNTPTY